MIVAAQPSLEPEAVVAGDFDGDGDGDLGVSASLTYDFVAGDGGGGFADPVNVIQLPALDGFMRSLGTGDVDGDGVAEVLAVYTWLGTNIFGHVVALRGGVSSIASYAEEGTIFRGVTASDIDGDGLDDVAAGAPSPVPSASWACCGPRAPASPGSAWAAPRRPCRCRTC